MWLPAEKLGTFFQEIDVPVAPNLSLLWLQRLKLVSDLLIDAARGERLEARQRLREDSVRLGDVKWIRCAGTLGQHLLLVIQSPLKWDSPIRLFSSRDWGREEAASCWKTATSAEVRKEEKREGSKRAPAPRLPPSHFSSLLSLCRKHQLLLAESVRSR